MVQSTSLTMEKGGESPRVSYPRWHTQLAKTLPRIDIVAIKGLELIRRQSCLSIFCDLCGFCLLDLGSEALKEWGGPLSNAVSNLTSVLEKASSKEGCLSSERHGEKNIIRNM